MDAELKRYYENRLAMMGTEAWRDLMEDVQNMLDANNNVMSIPDEKTLHFKRGEISMMNWLLTLKEMSRLGYEQQKEDGNASES